MFSKVKSHRGINQPKLNTIKGRWKSSELETEMERKKKVTTKTVVKISNKKANKETQVRKASGTAATATDGQKHTHETVGRSE